MKISFGIFATLAILSTHSSALNVRNSAKKCPTLSSDDVNDYKCGEQFAVQEYVHNPDTVASKVKQGEFPWSAVLMRKKTKHGIIKWKYLCGGTLINSVNVLTAAHCIQPKGSTNPLRAENMKVLLGAHNISETFEPCRKEFEVDSYSIHSGWDSDDQFKFTDDIALLRFKGKIEEFSAMIFPICLKNNHEIVNVKSGIISGYGEFNETRRISNDVPLKVELPIVDAQNWVNSKHRKLATATWNESFVTGSENAGVCSGDSGSGFYVKSKDKFYLRGLVSSAIIDGDCTNNNFALYTDVLKYLDDFVLKFSQAKFITKEADDCSLYKGKLECEVTLKPEETCTDEPVWIKLRHNELKSRKMEQFTVVIDRQSDNEVFCLPHFIDIENLEQLTLRGDGESLQKFTATDSVLNILRNLKLLKRFKFNLIEFDSIAKKILTKNFQIKELEIWRSDIPNLSAEMMKNLPMLKFLKLIGCKITTIPGDFFQKNTELEDINLKFNEIAVLPQNLLKNLKKLTRVGFGSNQITSISDNFFSFNHELEGIEIRNNQITQLPENLLKNLKKLKDVDFSNNNIRSIPDNFFSDNEKIEVIDFNDNEISELPKTLLKGLTGSLSKIRLWNNQIESIPGSSFFTENEQLRNKINFKQYRS